MEEPFKKIVSQIFNNWTALKMAVEHSTGGPNSRQTAADFVNYVVQHCVYENQISIESIQDVLEDIMDEEFQTVCEDESPAQIAHLLFNFISLLRQGKTEECKVEFQKLPNVNSDWLNPQCQIQLATKQQDDSSENSESDSEANTPQQATMEHDGWTEVKSRRKR